MDREEGAEVATHWGLDEDRDNSGVRAAQGTRVGVSCTVADGTCGCSSPPEVPGVRPRGCSNSAVGILEGEEEAREWSVPGRRWEEPQVEGRTGGAEGRVRESHTEGMDEGPLRREGLAVHTREDFRTGPPRTRRAREEEEEEEALVRRSKTQSR